MLMRHHIRGSCALLSVGMCQGEHWGGGGGGRHVAGVTPPADRALPSAPAAGHRPPPRTAESSFKLPAPSGCTAY